jgi:hypothetical protein
MTLDVTGATPTGWSDGLTICEDGRTSPRRDDGASPGCAAARVGEHL